MPSYKRKRSGPGRSFADRDAQGSSSGGSGGARDGGGRGKRGGYNQVYRVPSKLISGPGIFVTCAKGKERKAALQFIDHLNEIADKLYPGVELLPPLKHEDHKAPPAEGDDEDLMDAMRNGPALAAPMGESSEQREKETAAGVQVAKTQNEPARQAEEESRTSGKRPAAEDDIEAQIQAELAELRGEKPGSSAGNSKKAKLLDSKKDGDADADGVPTQRFKKIETDTECLLFISCARPLDPYRLVYAVLEEVEQTGEPRSRFVQRLSPVSDTVSAHPDNVTALAQRVIPTFFPAEGPARSFKIDPRIRSHNTMTRDSLIQIVAGAIPRDGGHYADLKKPDAWIIVEVHKNVCAIGVVEDYERYKKLNVQSVADAANAKKAGEADATLTSRIATSLKPQSQLQPTAAGEEEDKAAEPVADEQDGVAPATQAEAGPAGTGTEADATAA